jgi:hypothetical protein
MVRDHDVGGLGRGHAGIEDLDDDEGQGASQNFSSHEGWN